MFEDVTVTTTALRRFFSSQAGMRSRDYKAPGHHDNDDTDLESVTDEDFDKFVESVEGQRQIDEQLNFANHVYKNRLASVCKQDTNYGGFAISQSHSCQQKKKRTFLASQRSQCCP